MAKISVIITSFNHRKFIEEAIESVINQKYTDFEVIIWDDASSDNSWEIIKTYSDPRIKAFRNEDQRRGNWGINKAISDVVVGDYVAIHHSDDVWEPDKLEKQVAFLDENPAVGAVFTNAMAINEEGKPLDDQDHFYYEIFMQPNRTRHQWLNYFFYHCNALCHPSVLIRRECYEKCGPYRYGLAQLGDFDMWIRLCLRYEIHVLPDKLVRFRVRENEANSSGMKSREPRIRHSVESYFLLRNYLQLQTYDEMVSVFPEVKEFCREGNFEPKFALAMVMLSDNSPPWTRLFGLELLLELIWDVEKSKKIKEIYDFDYRSFIKITGKYDIFSFEEIKAINKLMNDEISNRDQIINDLKVNINNMQNSYSWKITKPIRSLLSFFNINIH